MVSHFGITYSQFWWLRNGGRGEKCYSCCGRKFSKSPETVKFYRLNQPLSITSTKLPSPTGCFPHCRYQYDIIARSGWYLFSLTSTWRPFPTICVPHSQSTTDAPRSTCTAQSGPGDCCHDNHAWLSGQTSWCGFRSAAAKSASVASSAGEREECSPVITFFSPMFLRLYFLVSLVVKFPFFHPSFFFPSGSSCVSQR